MEEDYDKKLYDDYLVGDKEAFDELYRKYKSKVQYFVFNIVKDCIEAEDITQDAFMYVMENKKKENVSFKYYIYLVARSRAINHITKEKRRQEIADKYLYVQDEPSMLDIMALNETKKEVIEAINTLDDKYRLAVYLSKFENLSYKEISEILGTTITNTKNIIHRGKSKLKVILLKKGFDNMSKVSKVICIVALIVIIAGAGVLASSAIIKKVKRSRVASMTPSYETTLDGTTLNNLWVGTLNIAWKELTNRVGNKIEIEGGNPDIVNILNNSKFNKDMLDSEDYTVNIEEILAGFKIDVRLNKKLSFLCGFENFSNDYKNLTFGDSEEHIKYFGIDTYSSGAMYKNVEVLFYNSKSDFAVKLFTKEGDEIILYRTDDQKSFEELYNDVKNKNIGYTGAKEFKQGETLRVPFVKLSGLISYNELYGKYIKDTGFYFTDVVQHVDFYLNDQGVSLDSSATLIMRYLGMTSDTRDFIFDDSFVIFMKEKDVDNPYFTLKVDNADILEKIDELAEPRIIDYTEIDGAVRSDVDSTPQKFFEDDVNEYYFPSKKFMYVYVYFPDGTYDLVKYALEEGKITIDLLDKYGVSYITNKK